MKYCIAIQPDECGLAAHDRANCSSLRWTEELVRRGHEVRRVDVHQPDILDQLQGCHAFMWRWVHYGRMSQVAHALLPVIERELRIQVFPDQNTCWHYDNKLAQGYLLAAAKIPAPQTWIWFDKERALEWAKTARYPLVLKLAGGAGATNVRLIASAHAARIWIRKLFGRGVNALHFSMRDRARSIGRKALIATGTRPRIASDVRSWQRASGYALFQEFLPDNAFDTRVTVIGRRAFAFRRFNRPNDFRASGSGHLNYNPCEIDQRMVRLAFRTAHALRMQSCAIDGLYRRGEPVVGEVSYTYRSDTVHHCPGHWELDGDAENGKVVWRVGEMWPEEAQVDVLLDQLSLPRPRLFLPHAEGLEQHVHGAAIEQVHAA